MKRIFSLVVILLIICGLIWVSCQKKVEEKVVKIGAVLVLTGPDAKAGQSAKQGIEMAVEEINASGGVKSRKIKVIYEDDGGEPQKSVSAVQKLINVDKILAILGPMWSSCVLAVAPIVESKGVVILSPTASSPKITYAGDYIFRNTYSDAIEGAKTAEFASKELKYGKAGILFINNDYGVGLKDAFKRKFEELGGKIVIDEGYDPKTTDFRTILVKVKERSPEVIYIAGYSEMGQLLRQMRETGIKIPVLSCIMFEISDIAKVAGKAAEGVIYAYPSYDPEKGNEITLKFAKKFKEKYGTLPDPEAAFSYDAVKILALAMEKGGFTSEDIKNALYKIKGYNGITGKTSFDENGDVIKPVGFKRVHNGKYEWLKLEY
ncbi:ABC transporter substrate-binding protein [bacterium]|nr:ABC transporter substrate-binding protein [bacterium]